ARARGDVERLAARRLPAPGRDRLPAAALLPVPAAASVSAAVRQLGRDRALRARRARHVVDGGPAPGQARSRPLLRRRCRRGRGAARTGRRACRGLMATAAVDHVVTRDQYVWGFGPDLEPVLEVEPGAVVRFETNDCFTGQIASEDDLVTDI